MQERKATFALFVGNRGFFPASLIKQTREELPKILESWGHKVLIMPEDATRHGAVETPAEGEVFARFLYAHRGEYDGVIVSLPNFGDENGAVSALKEAGVPIWVQAYPDDLDKMAPDARRDAFCGKLSIMDVFRQTGIRHTVLKPHVVSPSWPAFQENVAYFDKVCRVVKGMKNLVVGSIGARTTPFKTVRIDELALQKHGITVETVDLATVIARTKKVAADTKAYKDKAARLSAMTCWDRAPKAAFENIVKLGIVLDELVSELGLQALALRCWMEFQEELGISPCLLMGDLNERGIAAGCEVDLGSAVAMQALNLASGTPAMCLDWNNNYGMDEDKCILFHCGPVPPSMMVGQGCITDHAILATSLGPNRSFGPNTGRIAATDFTFGNLLTEDGRIKFYLGNGEFTPDPVDSAFFGCAGVARIEGLQDVLYHLAQEGHRHHVGITAGQHIAPIREALESYLGFDVTIPQEA